MCLSVSKETFSSDLLLRGRNSGWEQIRALSALVLALIIGYVSSARAEVIPANYFGLTVNGPIEANIDGKGIALAWPSWSPTTMRLWDIYGDVSRTGKYKFLSWQSLQPFNGPPDWTLFDAILAKMTAERVTDLIYTFGYTPSWAAQASNLPPTDMRYLADFATAIAKRSAGRIKYWEVWNEPNAQAFWAGNTAQMVTMAQTIYDAIKAVDPTAQILTPTPQGNSVTWMRRFLKFGGGRYADIMSFHGYIGANDPAETIVTLIDRYKRIFAAYGQSAKPIWDTEAATLTPDNNPIAQSEFLAKYYLLHWSKKVSRLYWYAYDNKHHGTLWTTGGLNAAGIAAREVKNWMLGATLTTPFARSGRVWSGTFSRANGQTAIAAWTEADTASLSVGSSYRTYRDLAGNIHEITDGSVPLTTSPVLIQTISPK
jgi:polysaccharide biosynthesis protein PslG